MTTLTLTKTLLNTDLSKIIPPSKIISDYFSNTFSVLFISMPSYSSMLNEIDPVLSNGGKTKTFTNPAFYGLQTKGSIVITYDEANAISTYSTNLSNVVTKIPEGMVSTGVAIKSNHDIANNILNVDFTAKDASFVGTDGSKWAIKTALGFKEKINLNIQPSFSLNWKISQVSSYDTLGNGIVYGANYQFNPSNNESSGKITSLKFIIGGKTYAVDAKLIASDFNFDYQQFSGAATPPSFDFLLSNYLLRGNDTLTVSSTDKPEGPIRGYGGNDKITGSNTDDTLYGGAGVDINSGNDTLNGAAGNDYIYGEDGNDTLNGGDGDDSLFGGSGTNKLIGGNGNDFLYAGGLKDSLTGGAGQDLFYITNTAIEVIVTDFKIKDGDVLFLDYVGVETGNFYKAAGAKNPIAEGQYYVYDTKTGKLYYDSDSFGGNDAIAIATLIGKPDIEPGNFILPALPPV